MLQTENEWYVGINHYVLHKDGNITVENQTGINDVPLSMAPQPIQDAWHKLMAEKRGPLAQRSEQRTQCQNWHQNNPLVPGSNPGWPTKKLKNLIMKWRRQATIEDRWRAKWTDRLSIEKSYGMALVYRSSANELEKLLTELSK